MTTDAGKKISQRDSVVSSINSPEEATEVVREFLSALEAFKSEHGFRSLAELVDRVPKLEADLREKERTLKLADETNERERATQRDELKKNLQLYNEEVVQFQKDKSGLEQQNINLKTKMTLKDKAIAELEGKEATLKEAYRKIEDKCTAMKAKLKAKDGEITQLAQQNQDNQVRVEKFTADLRKSQSETSAAKSSLHELQQHNVQLDKVLRLTQAQQEEIASYSVPLEKIDFGQL